MDRHGRAAKHAYARLNSPGGMQVLYLGAMGGQWRALCTLRGTTLAYPQQPGTTRVAASAGVDVVLPALPQEHVCPTCD